jgi:hypothetical protein
LQDGGRVCEETHGSSWLKAVRALDGHLELQLIHVLALTNAKVATEEVLLKLRNLGSDVAVLVIPLVYGRVLQVVGVIVVTAGLLYLVVNRDGLDPTGVPGTVAVGGLLGVAENSGNGSHVEGVAFSLGVSWGLAKFVGLGSGSSGGAAIGLPGGHVAGGLNGERGVECVNGGTAEARVGCSGVVCSVAAEGSESCQCLGAVQRQEVDVVEEKNRRGGDGTLLW